MDKACGKFDVCVSQTLSKNTHVVACISDDTNWKEVYSKEHMTPIEIIGEFKKFLTTYLPDPIVNIRGFKNFKHLINECNNWVEDETEIIQEQNEGT